MFEPFSGLVAPPYAPFDADGSLNLPMVDILGDHLKESGVKGVFVAGTTGESLSLSVNERMALTERWQAVGEKTGLRVIVQIGHNCLADSQQLAAHAQECGVDAIATMAPSFLRPERVEDLVDYCATVAASAGETPFYLYDIPSRTNVFLSMPEFLRLGAKAIPTLKGLKFTNPDLVQLQECLNHSAGRFNILWGSDEALLAALALGVDGAIGSTYNFAAGLYLELMHAFDQADWQTARQLQFRSVQLVRTVCQHGGFMTGSKAAMGLLGFPCGPLRAPLRTLTSEETALLHHDLKAFADVLSHDLISTDLLPEAAAH